MALYGARTLCDYCSKNVKDQKAREIGTKFDECPCYECSYYDQHDMGLIFGLEESNKSKDKEIQTLKEQVASLQRALAIHRDQDSGVDGCT